jgi:DNA mismatch repair protein MutS2
MDTKSFQTLEFDKVLNILAGYTSFSAGETLARNLQPTTDLVEAQQWQAETSEAMLLLDTHSNITIGGARDVRQSVENALRGFTLPAEDLLAVRSTIVSARNLRRQLIKAEMNSPTWPTSPT